MWARSVTGELHVVKCSNFSVQKYGKRVSQRKGCDVELLIFECRDDVTYMNTGLLDNCNVDEDDAPLV